MATTTKEGGKTPNATKYIHDELLFEATVQAQVVAVSAWVSANPGAVITPIDGKLAEGGLPPYLRRDHGKRANINRKLAEGVTVKEFLAYARGQGGGYVDLVAGLTGGYSRTANSYGRPVVELVSKG